MIIKHYLIIIVTLGFVAVDCVQLNLLKSHNNLPFQQPQQIVQYLKPCNISEEFSLNRFDPSIINGNYLLFSFQQQIAAVVADRQLIISRLQILPRDVVGSSASALGSSSSVSFNTHEDISTRFFLNNNDFAIYTNYTFDREQLISDHQCEENNNNNNDDADADEQLAATSSSLPQQNAANTNNNNDVISSKADCLIKLKIAAYDKNNNLVKIFILPIIVTDINDWRPEFRSTLYRVNISENLAAKSVIPIEAPVDADSYKYGIQECRIENNIYNDQLNINSLNLNNDQDKDAATNDDEKRKQQQQRRNLFEAFYNRNTQRLFLIVNAPLDRENRSKYDLILMCTDGASYARTRLNIDVVDANDNAPQFKYPPPNSSHQQQQQSYFNISIYENEINHSLLHVEAFDMDDPESPNGQIVFTLPVELNPDEVASGVFSINETSGVLMLNKPLDFETRRKFTLKVKVQDKGPNPIPAYTDVHINVLDKNDNAPVAHLTYLDKYLLKQDRSNNTMWINEEIEASSANVSTVLAYLTLKDADSPVANGYNLSAQLINVSFMNTSSLRMENEDYTEKGFTFRLVPIIEDYDNLYYALLLMKRIDREEKLFFDLEFIMRDNSNKQTFDQQQSSSMKLRVVLVDINDNQPVFVDVSNHAKKLDQLDFYRFNVTENVLSINFASVLAKDTDFGLNAEIEYQILDENNPQLIGDYARTRKRELNTIKSNDLNPNFLFFINADNGSISLRGQLDREQNDLYVFTVRASDKGDGYGQNGTIGRLHSDILVEVSVLDENDNFPIFSQADHGGSVRFELNENMPANTIVGNIKAYDPDLNSVSAYKLVPDSMDRYFYVDASSGNLKTKMSFDAEDKSLRNELMLLDLNGTTFKFQVIVSDPKLVAKQQQQLPRVDGGEWSNPSSKLNVSVLLKDLNDNAPRVFYPRDHQDKLIIFNLNNSLIMNNNSNSSINIKLIKSFDVDRDAALLQKQSFKFGFIRRMSWQFIYEILKNHNQQQQQPAGADSTTTIAYHGNKSNRTTANNAAINEEVNRMKVLKFVECLLKIQQKYDMKPISKLNLRTVFSLNNNSSLSNDSAEMFSSNLFVNQPSRLNLGIYNFSILIQNDLINNVKDDQSTDQHQQRTELSVKLFVFNLSQSDLNEYNQTTSMLTIEQFKYLDSVIDKWWSQNAALVANYKKKYESFAASSMLFPSFGIYGGNRTNQHQFKDDNGDDMDGITQDYYKFYAASAFSRFNGTLLFDSKNLVRSAFLFIFTNSSNVIIALISLFVILSIVLISVITYKHYKTEHLKRDRFKKEFGGGKQSKMNQKLISSGGNGSSFNCGSRLASSGCSSSTGGGSDGLSNGDDSTTTTDKDHKYETGSNTESTTNISSSSTTHGNSHQNNNNDTSIRIEFENSSSSPNNGATNLLNNNNMMTSSNYINSNSAVIYQNGLIINSNPPSMMVSFERSKQLATVSSSQSNPLYQQPTNTSSHGQQMDNNNSEQIKRYIQHQTTINSNNNNNNIIIDETDGTVNATTNSIATAATAADSFTLITSSSGIVGVDNHQNNIKLIQQQQARSTSTPSSSGYLSSIAVSAATTSNPSAIQLSTFTTNQQQCMQPHQQQAQSIQGGQNQIQCIIAEEDEDDCEYDVTTNCNNLQQQQQPNQQIIQPITKNSKVAVTAVSGDMGYYGSSDYSENNSFGNVNIINRNPHQNNNNNTKHHQYVNNPLLPNINSNNNNHASNSAVNSASSFTSSSLLSSPASSSAGLSSSPMFASSIASNNSSSQIKKQQKSQQQQQQQQPTITNLYPFNSYQHQSPQPQQQQQQALKPNAAELYFERFERIYNTNDEQYEPYRPKSGAYYRQSAIELNTSTSTKPTSAAAATITGQQQQQSKQHYQQQSSQRNSVTNYSYV